MASTSTGVAHCLTRTCDPPRGSPRLPHICWSSGGLEGVDGSASNDGGNVHLRGRGAAAGALAASPGLEPNAHDRSHCIGDRHPRGAAVLPCRDIGSWNRTPTAYARPQPGSVRRCPPRPGRCCAPGVTNPGTSCRRARRRVFHDDTMYRWTSVRSSNTTIASPESWCRRRFWKIMLGLGRWEGPSYEGHLRKMVIIGSHHTLQLDFPVGMLAFTGTRAEKSAFSATHTLSRPPFGWSSTCSAASR